MKRVISLLICITVVLALVLSAAALDGENYALFSTSGKVDIPINEHIGGDANGDGVVTLLDVVALLRASAGDTYNTSRDGLDVNEDGAVTVLDVIVAIRHIIGEDVGLGNLVTVE